MLRGLFVPASRPQVIRNADETVSPALGLPTEFQESWKKEKGVAQGLIQRRVRVRVDKYRALP